MHRIKSSRGLIVIVLAVSAFLMAFGVAMAATVQVSTEVPSSFNLVAVTEVLADENLSLFEDPDGAIPLTTLEIGVLRLQPPLEPIPFRQMIYMRNDSECQKR